MVPGVSAEPASGASSTSQPQGLSQSLPLQQPAGIEGRLSHVHSLPPEILGEVFMQLHLLPAEDLDANCPKFAHATAMFTVASVCKLWRAAALGRAGLWSRRIVFDFTELHKSGPRNEHWLLYLRTYLIRARVRPLCLYAIGLAFHSDWEGSAGQHAWRQILDALPRCVRFTLHVYPTDGTGDLLPLSFNIATPFLEEFALLAITPSNAGARYSSHGCGTFLPNAPRLRKLFLRYPMPRYITWTPFPALEELDFEACLTEPHRADLLDILPACEHISMLEICQTDTRWIDAARYLQKRSNSTSTLPNLRKLIDVSDQLVMVGQYAPLLARSCPGLQTLNLKAYAGTRAEVRAAGTLGANITTLDITFSRDAFNSPPRGILPKLLDALPALEELAYTCVRFCAADFEPLCAPAARTGRWTAPRLQRIKCRIVLLYSLEWVQTVWQLVRFVKTRTETAGQPGPLRVFEIDDSQFTKREDRMPEWLLAVIARLLRRVPEDDV
ncbi:hypothetical protein AURDEDRAFT_188235 [Auricularia subglabra TFB-10046 SS5]|uniref:Uncharacterized protein n=1 Tax=Auricularia subglabra (strain TFB-10046 / SS5) TaxID=717982 RepID=J0WTP3_AURST|nr:hypothetical protein AURDEDRAFT_188235 [Auricularia subglabra TFB-10046 SS5]